MLKLTEMERKIFDNLSKRYNKDIELGAKLQEIIDAIPDSETSETKISKLFNVKNLDTVPLTGDGTPLELAFNALISELRNKGYLVAKRK